MLQHSSTVFSLRCYQAHNRRLWLLSFLPWANPCTAYEFASCRYEHYARALRSHGLLVVPVEGDGNCLFRSVSHQIYGDDSHHGLVRARCMEYMEVCQLASGWSRMPC